MPPVNFPSEIKLDGEAYRARRVDGGPPYSTTYIPQLAIGRHAMTTFTAHVRELQLEPLNDTDWGDGRGWGQNVDTSEGMILPGPQVTTIALPSQPGAEMEQFAEQDGHIYVVGGRYAYRVPNGSDPPVQDQDFGSSAVAVGIVPFKSSLFVGFRSTANIWEKLSGGAWTSTMVGGAVQRGKLTTVWWNTGGGNSLRLVGEGATPSVLTYVAGNPRLDTDWTAAITVGGNPIRSMVASRYHAFVATTGGLVDFGSDGTAPNLTPEIEHMLMDTNGRATLAANGWVYINGGYGLKRVQVVGTSYANVEDCGWEAQLPRECPMSGYVTALVRHGRWLWASIYDGANTWVCKAREAVAGDRYGPLVWFVAPIYLANAKVTAMHMSGLVSLNPRLWMAVTPVSGIRALYWAPLPLDSAYRDLRQARLYRFASSYQYDAPDEDHGEDSLPKFIREMVGENENTGVGAQIALSVAPDGATGFTPIGSYKANPRAIVHPASDLIASRYILRHTGTGTPTTPPVLRKESRRVIGRPDLLEVRSYQIVLGPVVRQSDGTVDGRSIRAGKRALSRLQRAGPVSLRDEDQVVLRVFIAPGETMTEIDAMMGDGQERRMLVVDIQMSVLSVQGVPFKYGDGTKYGDSGKVFL